MNEPTNKPSSPIVVGFGSVPGGTGCTTLAIHAATFAARRGLLTLAISIDPSGDMLRRLGSDERCIDGHWTKEKRLKLAFCPPEVVLTNVVEYLPNLGFGGEVRNPEIIIVDLGPGQCPPLVSADYWVVPVMDSRSVTSIEEWTFPQGTIDTLFVRSQVATGGPTRRALDSLLSERCAGDLLSSEIPKSGLLRRAASERKTIWELGTEQSLTRTKMDWFCRELLGILVTVPYQADQRNRLAQAERIAEIDRQASDIFEQAARRSAELAARRADRNTRIDTLLSSTGPVVEPPSDEEVKRALEEPGARAVPKVSARKNRS